MCLDLRSSPQVSQPRVGGRAQTVDGAVGSGLKGMGGTMRPVLHGLQSETGTENTSRELITWLSVSVDETVTLQLLIEVQHQHDVWAPRR